MTGAARSHVARQLDAVARPGELILQQCGACGTVQYPHREVCRHCLADDLSWRQVAGQGQIQAISELHHSLQPRSADGPPWRLASVALDCGPVVLARLMDADIDAGGSVQVAWSLHDGDAWLLHATAGTEEKT